MSDNLFPYPGGKSRYADWILSHFPPHDCYVEVFGGSASVLLNKEPSAVEVYNDIDGNLVAFFRALRDHPDDLVSWLERTPVGRETQRRFRERLYGSEYPPHELGDVLRGGMFFYLQCTSFNGKRDDVYSRPTNTASGWRDSAKTYRGNIRSLKRFSDRFKRINIECLDYANLLELYDDPSTLFYLDPPYPSSEGYYGREFDHEGLAKMLASIKGQWILSYDHIPDAFFEVGPSEDGTWQSERQGSAAISPGGSKNQTELLLTNFDPAKTPGFLGKRHEQRKLGEVESA